jgi:hypothetical protein
MLPGISDIPNAAPVAPAVIRRKSLRLFTLFFPIKISPTPHEQFARNSKILRKKEIQELRGQPAANWWSRSAQKYHLPLSPAATEDDAE